MPTSAHLMGAIIFAVAGFAGSLRVVPVLPDSAPQIGALFYIVNTLLGGWLGWKIIGRAAQRGMQAAFSAAAGCAVILFLAAVFVHSFAIMIGRSLDDRYAGPEEALTAMLNMMLEYGVPSVTPPVLTVMAIATLFGGFLAGRAGRVWS